MYTFRILSPDWESPPNASGCARPAAGPRRCCCRAAPRPSSCCAHRPITCPSRLGPRTSRPWLSDGLLQVWPHINQPTAPATSRLLQMMPPRAAPERAAAAWSYRGPPPPSSGTGPAACACTARSVHLTDCGIGCTPVAIATSHVCPLSLSLASGPQHSSRVVIWPWERARVVTEAGRLSEPSSTPRDWLRAMAGGISPVKDMALHGCSPVDL